MFVRKFTGLAFLCCLSFVFANGLLASSGIKSDSVFDEMHSFYKKLHDQLREKKEKEKPRSSFLVKAASEIPGVLGLVSAALLFYNARLGVEGSVTLEFRDKALFKGKVAQMFYPSDAGFFSGLLYLAFLHRSLTKDKLKKWLTQK